jgi:hypothetical protein
MLPSIPQRQGIKTRQIFYPERDGFGIDPDPAVGYLMPLADEAGYGTGDTLVNAPVFKGTRKPDGVVNGMITAEGENPYGMEFRTFPRVLREFFGAGGYVRPGGGTTGLHRLFIPTDPDAEMGSCQLQDESRESPVQYHRYPGTRPGTVNLAYANEGVARYGVGFMGSGYEERTSLGGTVNDEGYKAVSYFNGHARLNGYFLVGMTDFSLSLDGGLSRADAAFRSGIAASINYGAINVSGRLGLMFSTVGSAPENNLNFYDMAVNQTAVPLEVMYTDAPPTIADQWCRIILAATRFSRRGFRPGGAAGKLITQDYRLVDDASADLAAEKFNTTRGPYVLTTDNKIGIKINGGATIPITLGTASTTITNAAAVAAINANVTFSALAVAEEFNGRIMLRTIGKGSTYSIQIDTAQTDSAHTILGFDGVAFTGYSDTPLLIEFYNDIVVDL